MIIFDYIFEIIDQFSELKNSSAFPVAHESSSTSNSQNESSSGTTSKTAASTKNIAAVLVNPKQVNNFYLFY